MKEKSDVMSKITKEEDFENIIGKINSFSHAYLLNTNNLEITLDYAKKFASYIILDNVKNKEEKEDIAYKIEKDIFDDLYIVNPPSLGITNEEIAKLLKYMETKSVREDGRRVYIINGIERITRDISNKILKFLEEPENNIYAILITSNIDQILSTIISRTQVINLNFALPEKNDKIEQTQVFLNTLLEKKEKTIAYVNSLFYDIISNREEIYNQFELIEKIISNAINKKENNKTNDVYKNENIEKLSLNKLINILDKTNKLKQLIKKNINLNLLIDRFIIEVGKELSND